MKSGKLIKYARTQKGYSLRSFADMINISETTLCKVENEKLLVSSKYVPDISRFLDIPEKDLSVLCLSEEISIRYGSNPHFFMAIKKILDE